MSKDAKNANMKTLNLIIICITIAVTSFLVFNSEACKKIPIDDTDKVPRGKEIAPNEPSGQTIALPMSMSANPKRSPKPNITKPVKQDPKTLAYIKRFKGVAKSEFHKYNIPPAIKLAQGILESGANTSKLVKKTNNHFGMKCHSKTCRKGHCINFHSDYSKDFFRNYKTSWDSYRDHSKLLNNDRYRHLQNLCPYDYKSWAKGLQLAGYATDKKYPEKLIGVIENYRLDTIK